MKRKSIKSEYLAVSGIGTSYRYHQREGVCNNWMKKAV
jgi:hypothetical protein